MQKYTSKFLSLVDTFCYTEVHVDEASSEVCREVIGSVHSGIKSACSVLNYCNVQIEDTFMCAGTGCTSDLPHAAVVVCCRSAYTQVEMYHYRRPE